MSSPYGVDALDQLIAAAGEDPSGETALFVILDGARSELVIPELKASKAGNACLYDGDLPPTLALCAPHLAELGFGSGAFTEWLLETGWGDSWGVFLLSKTKRTPLRKHFRKFLVVKRNGKSVYFRYYDPRVLRVYLPTCNSEELEFVFGPVDSFLCEAEDSKILLRYTLVNGDLETEEIPLGRPATPEPATPEPAAHEAK